ncbi:hypothetical protein PsorP6_005883 [Peronosclerospora sorghi]|uniref:Uncharacterized protein n=1 Tax=Peronosclerospora sorghi TaxID=230839 RepID=A0ACC0W236_9STRA|nr:hypothetical protein PsorP6_005883 [Peronosclerospora sorghi]
MYPLFVTMRTGDNKIPALGPEMRLGQGFDGTFSTLVTHLQTIMAKGLISVMLFGVVYDKDERGSIADDAYTPVIKSTAALRKELQELLVACDVCIYHVVDYGRTLKRLMNISLAYAKAGDHMVCPSDMMDNRIGAIRQIFNENGFEHVSIMAYTSKKASVMYAPFR